MPESKPIGETLQEVTSNWERGDFSTWHECLDPDLVVTGFDPDGTHRARGPSEASDYLRRFFRQFRDYRIEVEGFDRITPEAVLMHGRQIGTGRISGLEVKESLYVVFRLAGDRVIEMHWHPERSGALRAAGLEPG